MNPLKTIFRRLNVILVRFLNEGRTDIILVPYIYKKGGISVEIHKAINEVSAGKSELVKAPFLVVVSGKGVISKDISNGDIADMVTSDPEKFTWTIHGDVISFVRKEHLNNIMKEFENIGCMPFDIECMPHRDDNALAAVAECFYSKHLKWKRILMPSQQGSQLATHIAKKIQLPVLGMVILMLVVNFMISSHVNSNFQARTSELAMLQKSLSTASNSSAQKQAEIDKFLTYLPYPLSWMSDRIGAAVPDKVTLNMISISPVIKTIEPGKPVQQDERSVIIRGETGNSESISSFTASLSALGMGSVRLSSVEQDRERVVLIFRIDIQL